MDNSWTKNYSAPLMKADNPQSFLPAPDALGVTLVTRGNELLFPEFAQRKMEEEKRCREILLEISSLMVSLRARAQELGIPLTNITFPMLRPVVHTGHDTTQILQRLFSLHTKNPGDHALQDLQLQFSLNAPLSGLAQMLHARGRTDDVKEFCTLKDELHAIGQPVPETGALGRVLEWLQEKYLLLRNVPTPSQVREDTRGRIATCLEKAQHYSERLGKKTSPAEVHMEIGMLHKFHFILGEALTELHQMETYLKNPGADRRRNLHEELDRLQTDLARADSQVERIQNRIQQVDPEEHRGQDGRNTNGQRIAKHAGSRVQEERERTLQQLKSEEQILLRKQQDLGKALMDWRRRMDAFNPLAIDPEKLDAFYTRITQLQNSVETSIPTAWTKQDFEHACNPVMTALATETAKIQSGPVLQQLPVWIGTLFSRTLDLYEKMIRKTGTADTEILTRCVNTDHKAEFVELVEYERLCSWELAKYLGSHPVAVSEKMIQVIRTSLPTLHIPLPAQRNVNGVRFGPNNQKRTGMETAADILNKALEMIQESMSQSEEEI